METRYVSCADTAKLVRAALKKAFPGVKFSVRSKNYSGGASITINWMDGPTEKRVKQTTQEFEGATFDGMTDLQSSVYREIGGYRVRYGADWVHVVRDHSPAEIDKAINLVWAHYDITAPVPTAEDFQQGRTFDITVCERGQYGVDSAQDRIHRALNGTL